MPWPLTLEQKQDIVDACSDRVLELDELTGEIKASEDAWDRCTYTEDLAFTQEALKKRKEDDDFVRITQSTDKFIFNVETTGSLDADEVVMAALRVFVPITQPPHTTADEAWARYRRMMPDATISQSQRIGAPFRSA